MIPLTLKAAYINGEDTQADMPTAISKLAQLLKFLQRMWIPSCGIHIMGKIHDPGYFRSPDSWGKTDTSRANSELRKERGSCDDLLILTLQLHGKYSLQKTIVTIVKTRMMLDYLSESIIGDPVSTDELLNDWQLQP